MGWIKCKPIQASSSNNAFINDLERRTPNRSTYYDEDPVTYCHEMTHGVNARLRNAAIRSGAKNPNAFYCLWGLAFECEQPDYTLKNIAEQIPQEFRDSTYDLYLVRQRKYWNDDPLYVADEIACYLNGTKCGIENGSQPVRLASSWINGTKFIAYMAHFLRDNPGHESAAFYAYAIKEYWSLYDQLENADRKFLDYAETIEST